LHVEDAHPVLKLFDSLNTDAFTDPQRNVTFFHPDYTVGLGVSPNHAPADLLQALAGFTADREYRH